jgi:hypothetical protein
MQSRLSRADLTFIIYINLKRRETGRKEIGYGMSETLRFTEKAENILPDIEGSQAVSARPSG